MKKYLFTYILLNCLLSHAQDNVFGNSPVEGIKIIKKNENSQVLNEVNKFGLAQLTPTASSPTGNSTEAGVTEGQLSVSLTGGANYNIPIATAPGINGVVPKISLSYNSQGSNGIAGYGWDISGLSVISKIPSTKFHDNIIDGVNFNSSDRYAIDGQRLVIKSGTSGVYGANSTVYETEGFSNLKVTSYGVHPMGANYGPEYFIVQYPDGSVAQYGNSSTSRSITDWAITYWENPQGIRISYTYTLVNNNLTIDTIKYGSRSTTIPINEISFVYKNRNRPEQFFIGGQSFVRNTILSEIRVKGNNVGFRNYLLSHGITSLGYERLISITENSGDGLKSYNPTLFSYDDTPDSIVSIPNQNIPISGIDFLNSTTSSGDFDGDGKLDFLLYPSGTSVKNKYWLISNINSGQVSVYEHNVGLFSDVFPTSWLSWNNKLMPMQGWCIVQYNSTNNITSFKNYSVGTVNPVYFQYEKTFEFSKLVFGYWTEPCALNKGSNSIIGSTGKPVPPNPTDPTYNEITRDIPKDNLSGDFNGDGLTDLVIVERPVSIGYYTGGCNGYNATYTYAGGKSYFLDLDRRLLTNYINVAGNLIVTPSSKLYVADANGDGKSDVLVFDSGTVKVYSLDDNKQLQLIWSNSDVFISIDKPILLGDYNGDGKTDFIIPKDFGNNYAKYTSTGISYLKEDVTYDIPYMANFGNDCPWIFHIIPTDMDGDGKTDLVHMQSTACNSDNFGKFIIRVYNNKNNNFVNSYVYNSGNVTGIRPYAVPVFLSSNQPNQNLEIAAISNNVIYKFQSQKNFNKEKFLKAITIGNGVRDEITYSSLIENSANYYENNYTPSTYTENYPNFDISGSPLIQVVTKLERISHTDYKRQNYRYYGAVTNMEGLGLLGFRALSKTNWFNDSFSAISTISKNDIAKRGVEYESFTALGEFYGNLLSYSPSTFIGKTYSTYVDQLLPNKVYKCYVDTSITLNGLEGISKETTISYDVYNNPLTTSTITKKGTTIEQTDQVTLEYYNQSVGSPYYIGRPKKKNSSVTFNGETMTSEELYSFNSEQLLSQIKKKGNLTNYLTEDNLYDVFGNLTKKTITAVGITNPRETNYTYDVSGRFMISSKNVELQETLYTYDTSSGLLLTETLPSNPGYLLKTTFEYDSWGKKKVITDYLGKKSYFDYIITGTGNVNIINSNDDGSYSINEYDDLGRQIRSSVKNIDDKHSTVTTQYDIYNRKISISEPFNGLVDTPSSFNTFVYDSYGRTTQTIDNTGKTTNYSYAGLITTSNDGVKNIVTTKNSLGRIISITDNGGTITYQHFPNGNLKQSNFNGVTVNIEQDGWGRKTKLIDPSAGTYQYVYNEFGETVKEITPKGEINYDINSVGKVNFKTIIGTGGDNTNSKTTYTYDSTSKLLTNVRFNDYTGGFYTLYTYGYDNYRRLNFSDESGSLAYYQRATQYDNFGRPEKELYTAVNPSDLKRSDKWVKNTYKNGYHWQVLDNATSQILWQTNNVNARGQLTNANYGNGISVSNTYDQYGFPTQFKHDKTISPIANIMTLNYTFSPQTRNLLNRYNSMFDYSENFIYDNVDRLSTWKETGDLLYNCNFNSTTEGFQSYNGGTFSLSGGKLSVSAIGQSKGVQKLVLSNAAVGKKINIKGNVIINASAGNATLNISFYERDPASGNMVNNTTLGMPIGNGDFSFDTTVSTYSEIYVKFAINSAADPSGAFMAFSLDDIKVTLEKSCFQTYDNLGRIDDNNVGNYNYTNVDSVSSIPKYFQNSSIDTNSDYTNYYLGRNNLDITYNVFKSPVNIIEDGKDKISFYYNLNDSRSTMFYGSLEDDKFLRRYRKHYSADGSMEIKQDMVNGTVEFITYVGGDAYSAPIILKSDGTTQQYFYLHRDYQGTILAITNQSGNIVEKRLFDAWGNIARIQDGNGNTLTKFLILDRGYTGHEHLQGVVLINMNGRLYDPVAHRFLQPDNNIQDPYNSQNYNRYGYVMNNPLKYYDPSGESWWSDNWKSVVTVVAAVATAVVIVASMGTATPIVTAMWAGAGAGFVGGVVGTKLNGGGWGDAMFNGFMGAGYGAAAGALGGFAATVYAPAGAYAGAIYGGSTNIIIGGLINTVQGNPFFQGAALSGSLGAFGGGLAGYSAAKAQGLNPWTGATIRPKVVTIEPIQTSGVVTSNTEPSTSLEIPQTSNDPLQQSSPPTKQVIKIIKGFDGQVRLSEPIRLNNVGYNEIEPFSSAGFKSLSVDDLNHCFSNIVDNNMADAAKFTIKGVDGLYRSLYQIQGSLNGRAGIFEWIVEAGGKCTHRVFIPNAKITGIPNRW